MNQTALVLFQEHVVNTLGLGVRKSGFKSISKSLGKFFGTRLGGGRGCLVRVLKPLEYILYPTPHLSTETSLKEPSNLSQLLKHPLMEEINFSA